jgi:hypothetical protein
MGGARDMEDQQQQEWPDDKVDEWTALIEAAHPLKTKAYAQWDTAMRMVGNRHSKGALVELVCWLLQRAESASPSSSVLERAREALQAALLHHTTTSLPLVYERFGSREAAGEFGRKTWNETIPAALAEIDRALGGGNAE